jgi:hypothetical protein
MIPPKSQWNEQAFFFFLFDEVFRASEQGTSPSLSNMSGVACPVDDDIEGAGAGA